MMANQTDIVMAGFWSSYNINKYNYETRIKKPVAINIFSFWIGFLPVRLL
jgi:hypothetical protein